MEIWPYMTTIVLTNLFIYLFIHPFIYLLLMTNIFKYIINISKLSPEGEVDSGAHIPRRKASRLRTHLVV